jgi:DNA-binding MarR family transcriptional regulator
MKLTPMEEKVLLAISRSEYQHGTGDALIGTYVYSRGIADDAGISRRSAAGVFSSLSKKGLVNTAVHDEDVVALTAVGVEALPKKPEEAQMLRTNSFPRKNIPSHRRPAHGAKERGEQYAREQIDSDYFMDWVREQLLEASKADPSEMLPLETKADAMVIAKNMLNQLAQDTQRAHHESKEFYEGFRKTCDNSRDWLADELLTIKGEMGVGERRPPKAQGSVRRRA